MKLEAYSRVVYNQQAFGLTLLTLTYKNRFEAKINTLFFIYVMVAVELNADPGYKYPAVRVSGRRQRTEDNAQLQQHVLPMSRHLCLLRFPLSR